MKLRNKKTGKVANVIFYSPVGNYTLRLMEDADYLNVSCNDKCLGVYKTLADLNEEWEDYTTAEPKRYLLLKDLPTFKAGEVFELGEGGSLFRVDHTGRGEGRVMAYHKQTLDKFPNILEDWFEPIGGVKAEPLIKDEKIRKAVRAWAEACGAKQIKYSIAPNQYYDADMGTGFSIKFLTKPVEVCLEEGKIYTLAELCGEEEE